jgi:hypothetical protein
MNDADLSAGRQNMEAIEFLQVLPECASSAEKRFAHKLPVGF